MQADHTLRPAMELSSDSGLHLVRPWRVLLAHDATSSTCDLLVSELPAALSRGSATIDLTEVSSVDDAKLEARTTRFDVSFVCLDLPPAPLGGVRLAEDLIDRGAVVLVTRSLRWIPRDAIALRDMPWITPDASTEEVTRQVRDALTFFHRRSAGLTATSAGASSNGANGVGRERPAKKVAAPIPLRPFTSRGR